MEIRYNYSKLFSSCINNPEETSMLISTSVLSEVDKKIFSYVVNEIKLSGKTTGWESVWTRPSKIDDIIRLIYGKRCNVDKKKEKFLSCISDMSEKNILHGILLPDQKLSLSPELFFFSWKNVNKAIVALYPASIIRLYSVGPHIDNSCPFSSEIYEKFIRKKLSLTHPSVRLSVSKIIDEKTSSISQVMNEVAKLDPFLTIDRARFKIDLIPRSVINKGIDLDDESEIWIIPVSSLFNKHEEENRFTLRTKNKDEWKEKIIFINDFDLSPYKSYSHAVEYLSREIRRRKQLSYDYDFFIDVKLKQAVINSIKKIENVSYGLMWSFCRWVAENVNRDKIISSGNGKFNITELIVSSVDKFLLSMTDPGCLMKPKFRIGTHIEKIWLSEHPDRRFIYISCIYGIPSVCAYIKRCKSRSENDDPNEIDIGLAYVRKLGGKTSTDSMIKRATDLYATGDPVMKEFENMVMTIPGYSLTPKSIDKWPDGMSDFVALVKSHTSLECKYE